MNSPPPNIKLERATALKIGFSTGSHATAALSLCLQQLDNPHVVASSPTYMQQVQLPQSKKKVSLPCGLLATKGDSLAACYSIKGGNDDEDVTQHAKIKCYVFSARPSRYISQYQEYPHVMDEKNYRLKIHAGSGMGVATLNGLRVTKGYAAINHTPLQMMRKVFADWVETKNEAFDNLNNSIIEYHVLFEVEDGEKIAAKTMNQKVGVLGGISFLGSSGLVKPLSAKAYVESIAAQISVALHTDEDIYFVLGNTALRHVEEGLKINATNIVEIGNYIYQSLQFLPNECKKNIFFVAGIGKMTHLALGHKNTHSKSGKIDFKKIFFWLQQDYGKAKNIRILQESVFLNLNSMRELDENFLQNDRALGQSIYQSILRRGIEVMQKWKLHLQLNKITITLVLIDSRENTYLCAEQKEFVC